MTENVLGRLTAALSGRYTIERELGAGGMAAVYLAEDVKHRRKVAIKVFNPELAAAIGAERFLREVEVTANLNHPHILPLHDSGEAEGFLYYVMPYVAGETLRDRLNQERQLPLEDALGIAREVADGLSYAHSRGVIHRDIKPENILLESGHAVIADFGIARAVSAAGAETLTQSGIAVGTPTYLSPEQAAGERDLDGRSDQYSLACVLYEMLAGRPPFVGPTVESLLRQHIAAEPPLVTSIRPAVPAPVVGALHRALAKSPADRFNAVAQFTDALSTGEAATATHSVAPQRSGRRWIAALLGVAAVAVVAAVVTLRTGDVPDPVVDRPMLAVLPFENLSGSEDEYFAAGITEEITSRLAEISGLGVVSRTSALRYKGANQSLREIGSELGVHYVLEGTIRTDRRPGEAGQVRVTPQLIRAIDDTHLWTERYTASLVPGEIFEVQAAIAEQVAAALDVTLLAGEMSALHRQSTVDSAAHQAYLQGRYLWNRRTAQSLQLAVQYFADAVALDPQYASAYAGLADSYALFPFYQVPALSREEAYARAEESARRALSLDSMLASAHASLAFALMHGKWDWGAAEREFGLALGIDPDYATAHHMYAQLLYINGRMEEALAHAARAVELEPALPIAHHIHGWVLLCMGRIAEAEEAARHAVRLEPGFLAPHSALAMIGLLRGDGDMYVREAIVWGMAQEIARAVVEVRRDPARKTDAINLVSEYQRVGQPADPATGAMVYMLIGAPDSALAWSERAYAERSEMFLTFIRLPTLREAFADRRVRDIVRRIGVEP